MKRRGVLGLLSAGAATALLPTPAIGQMAERRIGIDAHTHIFNVLDLPWASFLWRVQARQFEETLQQEELRHNKTLVVQGLLAVLTSVVVRAIEPLKDIEPAPPGTPLSERFSRGATEERFLGSLAETLRLLFRDTATFERLYFPPFGEELAAHGRAVADMDVDRAAAAEAIREEINAQLDHAIKEHEEAWYQWAQTLANSSGWLGRGLDFGRRLASPKAENLDTLFGLYTNREGPALVAAALVDFSGWLDEEPTHSIADQIEQMDDLQWSTRTGTLMQMIVPFNPWRQVVADIGRAAGPDPLALITEAVEQRGAVGVKIYPPMGFLPIGNAEGDLAFPARAEVELGSGFRGRLDDALLKLYETCSRLDIPILAHTADGNEAGEGFGERAHPDGWRRVFDEFSALRVCMAHFGGFASDPNAPSDAWEAVVAGLAMNYPGQVFADLSYLTRAIPRHPESANRYIAVAGLQATLDRVPDLANHIVFGSDWHMISKERDNEQYPSHVEVYLDEAGLGSGEIERIFVANSLRLFGLVPGAQTYQRLESYYQAKGTAHFDTIIALNNS